MADQTIDVCYSTSSGFSFEQNGVPLPNGDVTVDTRGTNGVTFARKSGEGWTFESFSIELGVNATEGRGSDVVTIGIENGNGSSFSWTVSSAQVALSNDDQVPAGVTHSYEYSFVIDVPGVGPVTCDPKIYNRIG